MIGRLLHAIPARVGTPLSRVETVRTLLRFWATHGADWMPIQEQLARYVERHTSFRFDERVVLKILDCLVEARILHRVLVPPRTIQYRLDRRFADPMWPGFAREIDDLLVEPIPWPTADVCSHFFTVVGRIVVPALTINEPSLVMLVHPPFELREPETVPSVLRKH